MSALGEKGYRRRSDPSEWRGDQVVQQDVVSDRDHVPSTA